MRLYSTNRTGGDVSLAEAVLRGLAEDGGLFMPREIPVLPPEFFRALGSKLFPEIALEVGRALVGDEVPQEKLREIIEDAFNFPLPLMRLDERVAVLELFHGPTLAFKDIGARFMARLMGHFVCSGAGIPDSDGRGEYIVLVATSGDTGGAAAHGFAGVPGIRVVILYPSGQVSDVQEKQITTLGGNVTAIEVMGSFDDCQRLVKQALSDPALRSQRHLTTANSINIARLLPQSFYYFYAWAQMRGSGAPRSDAPMVFSVPSGNLGNLTAGVLARRMGLPIAKFVAATNLNDALPRYLESGVFEPRKSQLTISNAMDVGRPSNFARLLELYGVVPEERLNKMREEIRGSRHADEETRQAIARCWRERGYLLDPHTAVGWLGLESYARENTAGGESAVFQGIVLATAHPAKFASNIERATGISVPLPPKIRETMTKAKKAVPLANEYEDLRSVLLAQ